MWHKADWEQVARDPKSISLPREDWIFRFDAEENAKTTFDKAFSKVQELH